MDRMRYFSFDLSKRVSVFFGQVPYGKTKYLYVNALEILKKKPQNIEASYLSVPTQMKLKCIF